MTNIDTRNQSPSHGNAMMPAFPNLLLLSALLISACQVDAPTMGTSVDAVVPSSSTAVEKESAPKACTLGGFDYGRLIEDNTPLLDRFDRGMKTTTLPAGAFLCLHGPARKDASGRHWQQITVLPPSIEPACTQAGVSCSTEDGSPALNLEDCRIQPNGRYSAACPQGWVPAKTIETYSLGLRGEGAEPANTSDSEAESNEHRYARVERNGMRCEALARVGDDGLIQQPILRLGAEGAGDRRVDLPIGTDRYQARATHCIINGDAVLVLVQMDTHPSPAFSQTLLRVDRVGFDDGRIRASTALSLPTGVRSQWVTKTDGFSLENAHLIVRGMQRNADAADDNTFERRLDPVSLTLKDQ
ncbi:MAG TPA: hypothetical protein VGE64_09150 [Xanthomonadaceae bacterium]